MTSKLMGPVPLRTDPPHQAPFDALKLGVHRLLIVQQGAANFVRNETYVGATDSIVLAGIP
jgi:hypothetical protein